MTTETENVGIPEDLNAFKAMFDNPDKDVEAREDDGVDTEEDDLATDEDTDASEEDEDEFLEDSEDGEDEDDSDEDENEPEPEPKKEKSKKSDYQTRINELTRARREAERRETALLQRLEALEAQKAPQAEPLKDRLPQGAPTPDAVNDDGEPKYALGEFDPMFIRDLTRFTIAEETKAMNDKRQQEDTTRRLTEEQNALKADWSQKVDKYEEEVPEIRENIADLVDNFQHLDPQYGEYIATTIMQSENGPAIMEYLSQNIGEAQKIVASGPFAATLAIGRLDARLATTNSRSDGEEKRNKKASAAPPPPKATVKGSKGRSSVRPDTEDLAAFKREFKL